MSTTKRKNQEFRNFTSGIVYSLCIAFVLFLVTLLTLKMAPEMPDLLTFTRWSGISDAINLVIGLPIAFAGAYVAISIASRTQDLSEKQQSQQDHQYYEQLHEQLIDNYFEVSRAADRLVSAANRFEEAFQGRLRHETSSRFAVINFVDEDHRRRYIQDMLEQNRDGISDKLGVLHQEVRGSIHQLLETIDLAFKHASVNETWELASSDPSYSSLLTEACQMQLCSGAFSEAANGRDWLLEAKNEILERLDLHQIQDAIATEHDSVHPLLPYCLYVSELQDYKRRNAGEDWYIEVLLAGYFLMTHASPEVRDGRSFFNSGALFLMDLIHTLPSSEHVRLAFSRRYADTEAVFSGAAPLPEGLGSYVAAVTAFKRLSANSQHLFLMLSRNIQFGHYSPRIRKTRRVLEKLLAQSGEEGTAGLSLLQIRYERLQQSDTEKFD
ncbi:hypothetical protein [Marinobacterium sediminicola]|uniref:Phage abortive infection protein n=1 Tax=Marinobacterium sediminicola TaxID=518898 RepID=A0ABY1RWI4_9GAMM|nr:hypothetical protein [Marinobacterium sediminicola]ULG70326.1 hypothetical protein LN244_05800 [Marinobacterium sediminicola]SMR69719.1 hypothetical protein SAMN04487964_101340 [Marinobacterium sediminicola]